MAERKGDDQQAEELRRIITFQKQQAAAGKASSQYDLGVRYLKGDGVERDPEAARKWLAAAADKGHEEAKRRLRQLDATEAGKK